MSPNPSTHFRPRSLRNVVSDNILSLTTFSLSQSQPLCNSYINLCLKSKHFTHMPSKLSQDMKCCEVIDSYRLQSTTPIVVPDGIRAIIVMGTLQSYDLTILSVKSHSGLRGNNLTFVWVDQNKEKSSKTHHMITKQKEK